MSRAKTRLALALICVTCVLIVFRLSRYKAYFVQHGSSARLIQLFAVLLVYAIAVLLAAKLRGAVWERIFNIATVVGVSSGLSEILTIAAENNILNFRVPQGLAIISVFAAWGIAGLWAALTLNSFRAGLLASVASAAMCMLIGIAGGVLLELFVFPTTPAVVATWQEYKRSAWTDPGAFQIANTLDSAFGHLLLAPIVAAILGIIGAGFARGLSCLRRHSAL